MIFVMIQLNRGRPIGKLTLLLLWFKVGSLSTSSEAKYGKIFANCTLLAEMEGTPRLNGKSTKLFRKKFLAELKMMFLY